MSRKAALSMLLCFAAGLVGCAADHSAQDTIGPDPAAVAESIDNPCGQVTTTILYAGQTIDVGTVVVANDGTDLCVTYTTTGDWVITESHLHIAVTLGDIPQTKAGNPRPGKFAYSHTLNPPAPIDEYCFPLADLGYDAGANLFIAAHAVVERRVGGEVVQNETAWGDGLDFPGANWATYLNHTIQTCNQLPPFEEGEFRTQTQGQWGTGEGDEGYVPDRNEMFNTCLSGGLTVGCETGFQVYFLAAGDVEAYLPMDGDPGSLAGDYENPINYIDEETGAAVVDAEETGSLIGQVIALQLNVTFDACNAGFGTNSEHLLSELVVCSPSSPASGWTVGEVLAAANDILGGCGGSLTPAQIDQVLRAINENFVPGMPVGSYLCPPSGGGDE